MKTMNLLLCAGVAGGLFAAPAFRAGAQATNNPADTAASTNVPADDNAKASNQAEPPAKPETPSATDTNSVVDAATGELQLRMQFVNAPIDKVLKYMSSAAGYIIDETKARPSGNVTVLSEQPINRVEALSLVQQVLSENGYTGILGPDKRTLTIISNGDAKHANIPVILGNIPTNIPVNEEIVTQIIPVRSLNAVSLVKDLQPLLPADTTIIANESGNSLVMTDTQANIHRITEIVRALDSVSSASATIIVFQLKYADAKSVASLIKDLFPTATATTGNLPGGGPGGFFGRFMRGGGGAPGGGDNSSPTDTGAGHTPSSRVTAVSDDHANALVVSVPDDLVATIKELVAKLDTDVEDTTILKVFALKYADPIEMANELSQLFPDDTQNQDNSNFSSRFRFGFFTPPPQTSTTANESEHVRRQNRVLAVPDPRTRSLIVSASKDMMPQIAVMIEGLDNNPRSRQIMCVMTLSNAEVYDVLPVLQDLFTSAKTSSSSSANTLQNSQLYQRTQTLNSSFNSQAASFGSTTSSGSRATPGQ